MEAPSEFMIRSDVGVFRMRGDGKNVCGSTSFFGKTNGFECRVVFDTRTRDYNVSLCSDPGRWGFAEVTSDGRCMTIEGMANEISLWMSVVCPEDLFEDNETDARFFETSHGKIAYYVYNEELGGAPILMIHGGPGGDSNTQRARHMRLDHPVYLYDQLGCGRSDPIPDLSSWDDRSYMNELREFIDGMDLNNIIVIAASWGAGLAAEYAIETECEKISLMILPSPFFSSSKWAEDQAENLSKLSSECRSEMERCIKYGDAGEGYRKALSEFYSHYLFSRKCNSEIAVSAAEEQVSDVFLALWGPNEMVCTGNLKDFDVTPGLGKISVGTLLMCGDSDEVTLSTMEGYRNAIPGSKLCIIPDAGHALSFEQFGMYRQAIADFLSENGY